VSIWKRFSSIRVFSIDPQTVFTYRFLVRVKDLVLVELDVANRDDLAILRDPDAVDIIALIANEVADIYSLFSFISYSVLICQDLVSDGIGSTAISVDVCSVWLIH
jgi:hypothetical protein